MEEQEITSKLGLSRYNFKEMLCVCVCVRVSHLLVLVSVNGLES